MNSAKNYYQMLDVSTNASVQVIKRAIRDLRKQDHSEQFSILMTTIEQTLTDSEQRRAYDQSINLSERECINYDIMHEFVPRREEVSHRGFFDLGKGPREAVPENQNLINSPYKRTKEDILKESENLEFGYAIPKDKMRNFIIVAVILFIGLASFKPLYTYYTVNQQVKNAVEILKRTAKGIEDHIRVEKAMPDKLPEKLQLNDPIYSLEYRRDEEIVIYFTENSAEPLHRHRLVYQPKVLPSIGLQWFCTHSENFPENYLPAVCKNQ